ncbi:MAG: hypothetical protein RBT57_10955 [Paludibacter sp.]|jgi:uncharacterized membrane protein|nr:hypothetical protein [Paludibacter sp.]
MRLTSFEIASIVDLTKKHFAATAQVYLFGSRVDVVFDDDRVKKQSAFYHSIQTTKQLLNH